MLRLEVDEEVVIQLISIDRADELTAAVIKNREYLRNWLVWVTPEFSVKESSEFIRQRLIDFEKNRGISLFILKNGRIAGVLGARDINAADRSAEIGYWVSKNEQGNGLVTNSCRVFIKYLFKHLDLNRIVIKCATENIKSQAIPERLGFKKEGVLRQAQCLHDRFVDTAVFSLLKEEWDVNSQ